MHNELEQQISWDLAQRLIQHIDDGFRADALVAAGWTSVTDTVVTWLNWRPIETWLEAHCEDQYLVLSHCVLFKKASDATMFVLRWSQQ